MEQTHRVYCGRMDHGGCGLLVHVEENKVTKLKGDPGSFTRGYVCSKALAYRERLYHPDRLKYPLKRIGKRGEDRWKRISWDEAMGTISEKMLECKDRLGAEKVLFMQGTPKGLENMLLYRLAHSFGSPNVATTGTVCFAPRLGASIVTTGFYPHPDLEHPPDIILLWGANHLSTSADGILAPELGQALGHGSRIILIDPYKRKLSSKSDIWLRIKPGTDGLLAMGMIKVIIEEELFDQDFVEKWTVGIEELKGHAKEYSLSDITEKTWIDLDDIKRSARLYAQAGSGCILWGNAIDHTVNNVQTARALMILMALTGNLDRAGGNIEAMMPTVLRPSEFILRKKFNAVRDKMIGKDFKFSSMLGFIPYHLAIKTIIHEDPYKINFAYIQGTNPLMGYPNAQEVFEALRKVDFLVVADLFMNPTTQLADILLPVATHFEFDDIGFYGLPLGRIQARPKIVDPPGECLSDVKILNTLAPRLGLEDTFWRDEEDCIDYILEPSGMNFQYLKQRGIIEEKRIYGKFLNKGFRTRSGKVELYSSWMDKNGYAPLPFFYDLEDGSDREMNMVFTSAKIDVFFHSMNRNLPSLRKRHQEPWARIHPTTAKDIDLEDGDWAWIENQQGRARFRVKLNADIDHRVVIAEHAWWFPEEDASELYNWKDSNINILTQNDPPYEPSLGSMNLRGIACRVYKA